MAGGLEVAVGVNSILDHGRATLQGMLQSLPLWARGAVLAAGCVALVLGIAILAWLLKPGLFTRICCRKRRRSAGSVTPPPGKPRFSIDEELQLEDVTFRSWARGSLYEATPVAGDGDSVSHASHRDSTYSSMSDGTDTSSILSFASGVQVGEPPQSPPRAAPNGSTALGGPLAGPPSVVLLLQFKSGTAEPGAASTASTASGGRLAVTVVEARCLPARDYGCSPDPAVQVSVAVHRRLPFRWPSLPAMLRPRAVAADPCPRALHQLRTRTLRHARQPRYNEDFSVEARRADLKDWVLHVTVMDDCKLRGSTVLCRGEARLKQVLPVLLAESATESAPALLSVPLAPRPEERGLLLFGLSFLPTAQRLNVSLIKATRVRLEHVVPRADAFRPYVRVTLVHVGSGHRVDSARTDPQEAATNPEFCETLSLKLAPAQLGTLSLVVALCHRLPEGGERVPGSRRPRDRVVGAVAVGGRASSDRGREHWRAIEQRPRRVVSIWHTLT